MATIVYDKHNGRDISESDTLRPGQVVYRRLWKKWCSPNKRLVHLRCHISPYYTGRVVEDRGAAVLVEVFGKGRGKNERAVWPKAGLRESPGGYGPWDRCKTCKRAIS